MSINWREHVIDPLETTLSIRPDVKSEVRYFLNGYLESLRRQTGSGKIDALGSEICSQFQQELLFLKEKYRDSTISSNRTANQFKRLFERHEAVFGVLFSQLSSPQKIRADHYRLELRKAGFKDLEKKDTYISFIPGEWETRFPKTFLEGGPFIAFELGNRFPRITIKLMAPSLGKAACDSLAVSRRKLVELVQESGRADLFNSAFYKSAVDGKRQPKVPTEFYFSIFGKSKKIDNGNNLDDADIFIESTLKWIRTNLLPILEKLMERSGFQ